MFFVFCFKKEQNTPYIIKIKTAQLYKNTTLKAQKLKLTQTKITKTLNNNKNTHTQTHFLKNNKTTKSN